MDRSQQLQKIASVQYGYFTSAQAGSAGYPTSHQSLYAGNGSWLHIEHGLYRLPLQDESYEARVYRWLLWARNRQGRVLGVASHETALYLHRMIGAHPPEVVLSVPGTFRKKAQDGVTLVRETLQPVHIQLVRGFRVTSPYKTLVDIRERGTWAMWAPLVLPQVLQRHLIEPEALWAGGFLTAEIAASLGIYEPFGAGSSSARGGHILEQSGYAPMAGRAGGYRMRTEWRGPTRSFTLVEMLVVIAIIGILASLMMPAISSALESGRSAACGNSLRMIGIALATYTDRSGGRLPPLFGTSDYKAPFVQQLLAANGLGDSGNWADYDPYNSSGLDRLRKTPFFGCASVGGASAQAATHHKFGDYGFNCTHVFYALDKAPYLSQFKRPSAVMACVDAVCPSLGTTTWYVYYPGLSTQQTYDARHNGGSNMLFLDGHTNWMADAAIAANTNDLWAHVNHVRPDVGP